MEQGEVKKKRTLEELVTIDLRCDNERAVEEALKQLRAIFHESDDRRLEKKQSEFFSLGSHATVIQAMIDHPDHKVIQNFGLRVLMSAMHRNNEMKRAVVKVKGMHVVIATMKQFPSYQDIQFFGLKALKVSRLGIVQGHIAWLFSGIVLISVSFLRACAT